LATNILSAQVGGTDASSDGQEFSHAAALKNNSVIPTEGQRSSLAAVEGPWPPTFFQRRSVEPTNRLMDRNLAMPQRSRKLCHPDRRPAPSAGRSGGTLATNILSAQVGGTDPSSDGQEFSHAAALERNSVIPTEGQRSSLAAVEGPWQTIQRDGPPWNEDLIQ